MQHHHIAFWNLENLFAPQNHPDRQPWLEKRLKKDLKGWTKTLFKNKIKQLTSIIVQMNDDEGQLWRKHPDGSLDWWDTSFNIWQRW